MSIRVTGFSDDLIELDGDINEEFNPPKSAGTFVFSDGTVLRIWYDENIWRIHALAAGAALVSITAVAADESEGYTDIAIIDASYVLCLLDDELVARLILKDETTDHRVIRDPESGALYVSVSQGPVARTVELPVGDVLVDYDEENGIVGVKVLSALGRLLPLQ